VIIAGLATEGCVASTALAAAANGYRVTVALDASGHFSETVAASAVAQMVAAGVVVTTVGPILLALADRSPASNAAEILAFAHCPRWPAPPATSATREYLTGDAA